MKAQATESQTQKQLRTPNFPYLKALQEKAPIAHNGAKIQKMIIWVYLDAFHQQTMFIPKFKLLAAMHQPRQKAKMFLKTQVMMLICFSGTSPIDTQVMKMKKVKAIKRNEATTTAGLFPMSKTTVQMIFKAFVIPKKMWVFKLHTFLIKLQMLAKIKPPQMTAQIAKKNPGGVVQRLNLSETYLFLLIPKRQLTRRVQPNNIGVNILIGH